MRIKMPAMRIAQGKIHLIGQFHLFFLNKPSSLNRLVDRHLVDR
jgi:hypothetical protein